MANEDIRKMLKARRIYIWQVAKALGVSESTLIRWMREELKTEKKKKVIEAIDSLTNMEVFE